MDSDEGLVEIVSTVFGILIADVDQIGEFFELAAVFGARLLWLGIATMLVSVGNVIAHAFLFNIRGRTLYNPGMLTAIVLFLPIAAYFGYVLIQGNLATPMDWALGVLLGVALNFIGILKVIDWLKDKNTRYIFPKRSLLPSK